MFTLLPSTQSTSQPLCPPLVQPLCPPTAQPTEPTYTCNMTVTKGTKRPLETIVNDGNVDDGKRARVEEPQAAQAPQDDAAKKAEEEKKVQINRLQSEMKDNTQQMNALRKQLNDLQEPFKDWLVKLPGYSTLDAAEKLITQCRKIQKKQTVVKAKLFDLVTTSKIDHALYDIMSFDGKTCKNDHEYPPKCTVS